MISAEFVQTQEQKESRKIKRTEQNAQPENKTTVCVILFSKDLHQRSVWLFNKVHAGRTNPLILSVEFNNMWAAVSHFMVASNQHQSRMLLF